MNKSTLLNSFFTKLNILLVRLFLIGTFLFSQLIALAQNKELSGTVTDSGGHPLSGVTVVVKGTTQANITNIDGEFNISNVFENTTLVFSFVGMKTQEIPISNQTIFNVSMEIDSLGLNDVVQIGYGSVHKKDITGSIVKVKAEEFMKFQPANVQELLRSAVPGLKVEYSTSAKNSPDFEIRGDNTIKTNEADEKAGNRPLIVWDDVIFNGDITEINVNDIESVDVLKDAGAAAVYGSRSANGVVIITTKKGNLGKPHIRVSAKYGLVTKGKRNETYRGEEMLDWLVDKQNTLSNNLDAPWTVYDDPRELAGDDLEAWKAANGIPGETNQDAINTRWLKTLGLNSDEIMHFTRGMDFDWQDFLFHTGQRQDYDLSVSGRNKSVSYYWSMGFTDSESVQFEDEYQAVTSRLNLDVKVTDFLSAGVYANFTYQDKGPLAISNGGYHTASPYDTPWEARVWYDPEIEETGEIPFRYDRKYLKRSASGSSVSNYNPYLTPSYFTRKYDRYSLFPTAFAELSLPFGISFKTQITTRLDFSRRFEYENDANPIWGHGGKVRRQHNQTYEWQWDNIISWNKQFDKHRFDITGLINAERYQSWYTDTRNSNLQPTQALGFHGIGYGINPIVGSDDRALTCTTLMGRVNYAYSNRYNFSASIRQDAYPGFGGNVTHAVFPSFSAAWAITNESFWADKPAWLEFLRMRASWGVNGNSNALNPYSAYSNLSLSKILNWSGSFFPATRLSIVSVANKNLAWEQTQAFNLALDYGIWEGRISGAIDVYSSKTTDILLNKKLPIITGFEETISNVGSLKNRGFELSVNTINIKNRNVCWATGLNVSYNKNKILALTGEWNEITSNGIVYMAESHDIDNVWFIGENKDVIWNFEMGEVYTTDEADEAAEWGLKPGDFRVVDQNNDGRITTDDKIFQGASKNPWYITMRNDFSWKNFDVGIVFLSKLGYKAGSSLPFNTNQTYIKSHNWYKSIGYWMPDKQLKNFARINSIRLNSDMRIYVPKDYLRLQNLSIGYTIPPGVLKSIKVSRARLAFHAENVFLITQWYEGDPESNLEMPRIWSFSIDFSF